MAPSGEQNAPGWTLPTGPPAGAVVFGAGGFVVVFVFAGVGFLVVTTGTGTAGAVVGTITGATDGDGLTDSLDTADGATPTRLFGLAGVSGSQAASAATVRTTAIQRRVATTRSSSEASRNGSDSRPFAIG